MKAGWWLTVFLAGCCLGGGEEGPKLPLYTGSRDPDVVRQVLTTRYGWTTLAATGTCTLKSTTETRTFNFELLADRKKGVLVFTGDKTLTGTLFRLEVTPTKTQMEDFTQDEPATTLLDPSKPLDVLGGGTVEAIRKGLLIWPPRGEMTEKEGILTWDPHTIDKERLSIEKTLIEGLTWIMKGSSETLAGRVRHDVWVLSSKGSDTLSLAFDSDVEFDADLGADIP